MLCDKLQEICNQIPKLEDQSLIRADLQRTDSGCVVIQTCDVYKKYWPSFFWSFKKYWDATIPWPVFFCNEELKINNFDQITTGKGSHSQRMAKILDSLPEYDYVFYMLEDFWLTDRMTKEMFMGLFDIFHQNNWDSLRVAPVMPSYYKLEPTTHYFQDKKILKYAKDSKWKFSQQAAFWKKDFLRSIVVEPQTSETLISTSLSGEIAMDEFLDKKYPDAQIHHYHYHWYPVSGSVWRGELTQIGQQIEFMRQVDEMLAQI